MTLNETTQNLFKVLVEFKWPDPVPVSYRLYYHEDGSPKCYTMEDLPGKYIQVDRETYLQNAWNVKVVDDKLHIIPRPVITNILEPNQNTGTACHPQDVCVVVTPDVPHIKWQLKNYETY